MNSSINLLDQKSKIQQKPVNNKQRWLRIIAACLLFIVAGSSIVFFILVTFSPLPQLRKEETVASYNLSLAHPDIVKLAIVKERTDKISQLINKRSHFDNVLGLIQDKLPPGVTVDSVDISEKNKFSVVFSSNSLRQLDLLMNGITQESESKKEFSQVNITNLSVDDKKNLFLLTLDLNTL